ncbi:hypothetical protein EFL57_03500 [Weissella confusa]|uniref:hypothetical protein n=1 Tax=Weissella confusa TaxID=1583 RepID=UPI00223B2B4D|nr:hypothetical protein [Weissella confusa]MCT0009545.1 hypothetical protein [Weissella confusa]
MPKQIRPKITNGKTGIGNFGVGVMPDGTSDTLRVLIEPDGFHFEAYDFDDLVLPSIALHSPIGSQYTIGFDDTGALLINGAKYVAPTNQANETIAGDKKFTGKTDLVGGLKLTSATGVAYDVVVDDNGVITTIKEKPQNGQIDYKS